MISNRLIFAIRLGSFQKSASILCERRASFRWISSLIIRQTRFKSVVSFPNSSAATLFQLNRMSSSDSLKRKVEEESTSLVQPTVDTVSEQQQTKRSKADDNSVDDSIDDQKNEQQIVQQSQLSEVNNGEDKKVKTASEEFGRKYRPKKFAILVSYSGVGYFGLQRNNPFKTIEDEILKVWLQMELLLPDHYERPQTVFFQRAARTDKGVSAAKQILTCRLPEEFPNRISEVNKLLPEDIRIFGAKRTTKFFDSRTYCDGRTYSYMLPTFALAKPDQLLTTYYRIDPSLITEFNRVLKLYKGTHNFHNFTSGKKATDASSMRFMMEVECGEPFIMEEMEFAIVRIKGQSFMLHQIRKMVGLAIAVMRGNATEETIQKAFQENKIDIPIAPGLGLMLDEVHYDRYNIRYGGDGLHEAIIWPELNEQVEEFKRQQILPNVYKGEKKEFSMMKWLQSLPIHTYGARDQEKSSEEHQKQKEEILLNTEQAIENELNAQKEAQAERQEPSAEQSESLEANGADEPSIITPNGSTVALETVEPELAYQKAYVNAHYLSQEKVTQE